MDQAFQNMKEWFGEIARHSGGSQGEEDSLEWIKNPHDPWYGGVFGIQPEMELALFRETVKTAREKIQAGQFPAKLMLCERDQALSPEQKQCLEEQGFHEDMWQTGMELALLKSPTSTLPCPQNPCADAKPGGVWEGPGLQTLPEGDFIWLTEIPAQVQGWAAAVAQAFSQKEEDALVRCFADNRSMDLYYYLHNDAVAATGLVYHQKDVAGIYLVGTAPEFRRRGFADALVRRALEYEGEKGVSKVVLQASEMGLPVYERIGFQVTGRISHWECTPLSTEDRK